jgi:N-sulfoglucosamine sulfohydrolase
MILKAIGFILAAGSLVFAKPNLLLITVDDMEWNSVGAFGCEVAGITPNLDRLAKEGVRFDRGFVTVAVCQPSRAVWMSGRYPQRNGTLGFEPMRPDVPSLPEALQAGGYFNGLLGKALHVLPERPKAFDLIRDQEVLGQGRDPGLYAAGTRATIQAAKAAGKPFFLMANAHDPHRPFAGSEQERWRPRPEVRRTVKPEEVTIPAYLPDLPEVRREIAQYYTSVHRADEVVGAILAALEEEGVAENTLVMFMSDNGMPLPFSKTNCYDFSTRTPWIVRWPGRAKAGTSDARHFINGIDVAPTFLDAAGLPPLPGADGKSIVGLLEGKPQEGRGHVFTMMEKIWGDVFYPMRAVRDEEYIYIWNGWADGKTVFRNESQSGLTMKAMREAAKDDEALAKRVAFFLHRGTEELYDLKNDPNCLKNLLEKPDDRWTPRASAMSKRLWHWMKEMEDPQLKKFEEQVDLALD